MSIQKILPDEFADVKKFYSDLIDEMGDGNESIGWKKGVYPSDGYIAESIEKGCMYKLEADGQIAAVAVADENCNGGYDGVKFMTECDTSEVWAFHALAVSPRFQGKEWERLL